MYISTQVEPPTKLSEAIIMALDDMRAARESGALIRMHDWVRWSTPTQFSESRCEVCMAGAIMHQRFNNEATNQPLKDCVGLNTSPEFVECDNKLKWRKVFYALNVVRDYKFTEAMSYMDLNVDTLSRLALMREIYAEVDFEDMMPYESDPRGWEANLRKIAAVLAKEGF